MAEEAVYKRRKQVDLSSMDAANIIKECLSEDFADARNTWEGQHPETEVVIPVQQLMDPVAQYALNAVILFFPGKMLSGQDVGQWVDFVLKRQAVRGVYFGARENADMRVALAAENADLMGLVFLLSLNPQMKDLGEAIGFGTALLFVAVFGIRFAATKKVFPAAPLLLISIVASAVFVGAYLQDRV
ncbi:hypothetical protein L7F22_004575 [Adiantum nelumboides]|nr:hypothetical protein [Adiantum nelumboides]